MNFIVYQMDMKSAFLNGEDIKEVSYVKQPQFLRAVASPVYVWKLDKAFMNLNKLQEHGMKPSQPFLLNTSLSENSNGTPNNLGPDLNGKSVNETRYRSMIGSLMYLTARRPVIQFLICLCARYQATPKESHLVVVERIFRYLKVLHSRTKHVDIRHHFIRDDILKGDIELHFIPSQYQLADIFTKPLDEQLSKD
ncbi:retrovirus-related pol polyprotein from transposon TNT 1-94 [Tanacetum coccineum]